MKKNELIIELAEKADISQQTAKRVLDAYSEIILETLKEKDSITIGDIGQLKYKLSNARTCRVITTGETMQIPTRGSVALVLSKSTKEILSKIV